eukprot:TRINITY_DN15386_c0_g1_i1.p3 TRINITY_DN15386_c0_g1~~TRINITY_DN15386_c0_g1_i1.p3  ORF type:complete len:107 (-),score=0.56 TRINITY_DN15386_c0_g1_i1:301-621(-)
MQGASRLQMEKSPRNDWRHAEHEPGAFDVVPVAHCESVLQTPAHPTAGCTLDLHIPDTHDSVAESQQSCFPVSNPQHVALLGQDQADENPKREQHCCVVSGIHGPE